MMAAPAKTSWRTHPESVEAFQSLDLMLPTVPVPRGAAVRTLESTPIDLQSLGFRSDRGDWMSWQRFLEFSHSDGFIILRDGRILFEHYANGMTETSRHMAFSITKSVVGLLAEILAVEGAIALDQPAHAYLPELRDTAFGVASLESLLAQRDGTRFDETYADPDADIHRYSQAYWGTAPGGARSMLASLSADITAADRFAYRTPPADVVGWALARATGTPLEELVSARIWKPMGAEADGFFVRDTAGVAIAGAGLNCRLRDLVRIGLFLLEGAPASVRSHILAGGCRAAFSMADQPTRRGWSYQSFWWNGHSPHASAMALGVYGQRLVVEPESGTVIARFGSHPVASSAETDSLHAAAFGALADFLAGI